MKAATAFWIILIFTAPLLIEATTGCDYEPPRAACDATDPTAACFDPRTVNAYTCSCNCTPGPATRSLRVAASEDDAEESGGGAVKIDPTSLDFGQRVIGVRFRDVQIPQGASIISAHLQFTASRSDGGDIDLVIDGEAPAGGTAAPFSAVAGNLSGRTKTSAAQSVPWSPPDWTNGDAGPAQLTPSLQGILQEIVNQGVWAPGNALVLLITNPTGAGVRRAHARDGRPDLAALLEIRYTDPAAPTVARDLNVCVPLDLNANQGGTTVPDDAAIQADCSSRVQTTLGGLNEACGYPPICTCTATANSQVWGDKCDANSGICAPDPVEADCSDFNPPDNVTATHAAGHVPEHQPVCLANSALSSGIFGRQTTCEVEGTAPIVVEGDSRNPGARGIVEFSGDPCPGQSCSVGLAYRLDIDDVTFGNFFGSATFTDLAGLGESLPSGQAQISATGEGTFGQDTIETSARGQRGSDSQALATGINDFIDVDVIWGSVMPTCALDGTLIGNVDPELKRCENAGPSANAICQDDSGCTDDPACSDGDCNCEVVGAVPMTLALDLEGDIVNQPPTAEAGAAQIVECNVPNGAELTLNASGSSDLDGNIVLFDWFRGTRTGEKVGFDVMTAVEQPLGTQAYILRVIDALAQADEDQTLVTVQDTTPPVITSLELSPTTLWPPNHKLVKINAQIEAEDVCDPNPVITLESITSNEPDDGIGDGKTTGDFQAAIGTGATQFSLRAERMGPCTGRVYTVVYSATDASGNSTSDSAQVTVAHDQGKGKAKGQGKADPCTGTPAGPGGSGANGPGGGGNAGGTAGTGESVGGTDGSGGSPTADTDAGAVANVDDDAKGHRGRGKGVKP